MLRLDVTAEDEAICLYAESMDMCRSEGDEVSGALFESILRDEIAHSAAFRALIA
jgi:bacterioferritin (cytochrome b1)